MIEIWFYKQNAFQINQNFQFRAMKLSLKPACRAIFFCIIWIGLGAYGIDLDPCYKKIRFYI